MILKSDAKSEEKLIWFEEQMTWGIWQIFTRALESLKIGGFNGILLSKVENV